MGSAPGMGWAMAGAGGSPVLLPEAQELPELVSQQMLLFLSATPSIPPCNSHKPQVFWREEMRQHQGGAVTPIPHPEQLNGAWFVDFSP